MDSTTQFVTFLIIFATLITLMLRTQIILRRRSSLALRTIRAYDAIPLLVGESIEADQPLHLSFGSAGLGGSQTLTALVTADFFYQVARRSATGTLTPIITMSNPTAIPLAQDTLRSAYRARRRLERYQGGSVRWYAAGGQSLAFAAALTATLGTDNVATNVLAGRFGNEMALVLDAAYRRNQSVIATSDQLEGQALAYALAERPLIGEELFAADAYLGERAAQLGTIVTIEVLRFLLILAILLPAIIAIGDFFTNDAISGALFPLVQALLNAVAGFLG